MKIADISIKQLVSTEDNWHVYEVIILSTDIAYISMK